MRSDRWIWWVYLGGSFFLLFFNLWGRTLENHDYLKYSEVAKEMIQSKNWIVPRLNGEIYLHKPPLLFWLIAITSKIYGSVTPFLARMPSAFFAWIGGLIVYLWGKRIWGSERLGFISGGILISSYLYFWQGRIARTDMLFSVLILLSLYFFYFGEQNSGMKYRLLTILSFIFMALAGLTKGPVGILFPLLIIFLFQLTQRRWKILFQKEFILGYMTICFILGLWIVSFFYQVDWETAVRAWEESKVLTRSDPFYIYFYRLWIDFIPWSVFLPSLFIQLWKKEKNQEEIFLILWFLSLFILLTLFPYRASRYLLPAFPALALLMGGFWRGRSSFLFLMIFLAALMSWHGYEFFLIKKNEIKTTGPFLFHELSPYQEELLLAYQMDEAILEKINFYGDKLIPQIRKIEELKEKIQDREEVYIITSEKGLKNLIDRGISVIPIKKINDRNKPFMVIKIQGL
ncbi:MAG: glycosyltransferase family 39 protein [Candidatus Anstonellales archaeon]